MPLLIDTSLALSKPVTESLNVTDRLNIDVSVTDEVPLILTVGRTLSTVALSESVKFVIFPTLSVAKMSTLRFCTPLLLPD